MKPLPTAEEIESAIKRIQDKLQEGYTCIDIHICNPRTDTEPQIRFKAYSHGSGYSKDCETLEQAVVTLAGDAQEKLLARADEIEAEAKALRQKAFSISERKAEPVVETVTA